MTFTVRSWHTLASGNVCATVVDAHGEIVTVTIPRAHTSWIDARPIIEHALQTRPRRPGRVP